MAELVDVGLDGGDRQREAIGHGALLYRATVLPSRDDRRSACPDPPRPTRAWAGERGRGRADARARGARGADADRPARGVPAARRSRRPRARRRLGDRGARGVRAARGGADRRHRRRPPRRARGDGARVPQHLAAAVRAPPAVGSRSDDRRRGAAGRRWPRVPGARGVGRRVRQRGRAPGAAARRDRRARPDGRDERRRSAGPARSSAIRRRPPPR